MEAPVHWYALNCSRGRRPRADAASPSLLPQTGVGDPSYNGNVSEFYGYMGAHPLIVTPGDKTPSPKNLPTHMLAEAAVCFPLRLVVALIESGVVREGLIF